MTSDRSAVGGELAAYALAKPGAWADQPWEGDHVAKVAENGYREAPHIIKREHASGGRRVARRVPG